MPYDEAMADRVRAMLTTEPDISEVRMFGGIAFMSADGMACGLIRDDLLVRVGPEGFDEALGRPGAGVMDFDGKMRPMKGMVKVAASATADEASLRAWVAQGLDYVRAHPTKKPSKGKSRE